MRNLFTLVVMLFVCSGAMAQLTEQQQIQKLNFAYQQIRNNYVDDVELKPLVDEAIRATIAKLDPHSNYQKRRWSGSRDASAVSKQALVSTT